MLYRELDFNHSKVLSGMLYDIYELSSKDGTTYTSTPNGIIGITINTSGDCFTYSGGEWEKSPGCSIYGLIDTPQSIRTSSNFRELSFGFKPFFFQLLTREKMANIVNIVDIDASLIFSKQSIDELVDKLKNSRADQEIIEAMEHFILSHYLETEFDNRVLEAMNMIYTHGVYNVDTISSQVNLSTAGLRNLFTSKIGRSPKSVSSIIRINKLLDNVTPDSSVNLQDLAYDNGYFDQSHFNNNFKKVIGLTPKQYFSNDVLTFDFYNYRRWTGDIFA